MDSGVGSGRGDAPNAGIAIASSRARNREALVGDVVFAAAVGLLVMLVVVYVTRFHGGWDDALNYLAAGERLNAGHQLYTVVAGDRAIDPQMEAGYGFPLVSPPLVAVVWRPLAALGDPAGVATWWFAMVCAIAAAVGILHRWSRIVAGLAVAAASPPLLFQLTGGNMNAALILGAIVAWWAFATGRPATAGAVLGVALVAKGIPAPLCVWILASSGGRAWRGLALGAALALVVSLAGATILAHVEYAEFALRASAEGTGFSLAGLATAALGIDPGVARYLPFVALAVGSLATVAFRGRPSVSFAVAVLTMVFGFNGVHFHSYALLLPAAAPLAWALRDKRTFHGLRQGSAPQPVAGATISPASM